MRHQYLQTIVLFVALLVSPAVWAQALPTTFSAIGYSPDGRYFAFEEFGRAADSQSLFVTISVRDVVEDRWVLGTPARTESLDPNVTLGDLRLRAEAATAGILADLDVHYPAVLLAANGAGELNNDGKTLSFGVPAPDYSQRVTGKFDVRLELFDTLTSVLCAPLMEHTPQGFALYVTNFGTELPLHRDNVLPRSRGCPYDYTIAAVFAPLGATDTSRAIALIASHEYGDDGQARSYYPVPLGLGLGRLN